MSAGEYDRDRAGDEPALPPAPIILALLTVRFKQSLNRLWSECSTLQMSMPEINRTRPKRRTFMHVRDRSSFDARRFHYESGPRDIAWA